MVKYAIAAAALSAMLWSPAQAEMNGATRIGVLNDMSSVYSDFQGPGSVVAAQMAAEQFAKGSKRSSPPITRTSQTSAPRSRDAGSTSKAST